MSRTILVFLSYFIFSLFSCNPYSSNDRHIIYLHGKIIEDQGKHAVSEKFGPYKFDAIVNKLKETGAIVHADIRDNKTNFTKYCQIISKQISQIVESGVPPNLITVIGASKGGVMAMQISSTTVYPINYVLLGANNKALEKTNKWILQGNVLGIYEATDQIAGKNYDYWINRSKQTSHFEQLEIKTGLGHGFIYSPRVEWLDPTLVWINKWNGHYKRIR